MFKKLFSKNQPADSIAPPEDVYSLDTTDEDAEWSVVHYKINTANLIELLKDALEGMEIGDENAVNSIVLSGVLTKQSVSREK